MLFRHTVSVYREIHIERTNALCGQNVKPFSCKVEGTDGYRNVVISVLKLCYCIHVYMLLHNLLNVLVRIANKMGLQKQIFLPCLLFCSNLPRMGHSVARCDDIT
jgi:hypothetical protein